MNEWQRQRELAESFKSDYPPGTRIELISMGSDPRPVESGTRGTVRNVDAIGTIHCDFDNGRTLGLIPAEDRFRKLTEEELAEEQRINQKRMAEFGDGCKLLLPDDPIDCSRTGYFDELENECWSLVKMYCAQFGIEMQPIDEGSADISFDIAKGIQDHIIEELQKAGVQFNFEAQEETAGEEIAPMQQG